MHTFHRLSVEYTYSATQQILKVLNLEHNKSGCPIGHFLYKWKFELEENFTNFKNFETLTKIHFSVMAKSYS